MSNHDTNLARLTTGIVAAYVETNEIGAQQLPDLIRSVHQALGSVDAAPETPAPAATTTAAQIRRSITPDALISFEDGKPYKQLKRHLTALGMTPDHYRAKWGLPSDYPMVAASYSAARSAMAKTSGLGKKTPPAPPAPPIHKPPAEIAQPAEIEQPKARIKGRLGLFGRNTKST